VPEKSTIPLALVTNCALPPVLVPRNWVFAPALVVMVALAAVLVPVNDNKLPAPLAMAAVLADVPVSNVVEPLLAMAVMPDVSALTISNRALLVTVPTILAVVLPPPSNKKPLPLMVVPPV